MVDSKDTKILNDNKRAKSNEEEVISDLIKEEIPVAGDAQISRLSKRILKKEISIHSGPLPSPEILSQYDAIIPNGAERIMVMAETQHKHRIEMEQKVTYTKLEHEELGLKFSFILILVMILGGLILIYKDKNITGFATIITAIASITGTFVYSKRKNAEELKYKHDLLKQNMQNKDIDD